MGEKRRGELLRHFKSVKKIRAASPAELEEAVPKSTAQAVYAFFHPAPEPQEGGTPQ